MNGVVVGINLPDVKADPEATRARLSALADDGFDCIEVGLDDFPLIINGEIKKDCVDFVSTLLREFKFKYTAHIGRGVDLRDTKRLALQKKVLASSIEACARLGIRLLVLHFEAESRDLAAEQAFYEGHIEAADRAAELGVALRLENIEVDRVDTVVDFIKKVGRKDFLLAFDTGHAYLAAKYFHFDFLESLRKAIPYVGHVHLSDNVGTFEELRITNRPVYDGLPMGYRLTFGRGDIHIPPFWGEIPYPVVFALLKRYEGVFLCEYNSELFVPFNKSVQERVRTSILSARS